MGDPGEVSLGTEPTTGNPWVQIGWSLTGSRDVKVSVKKKVKRFVLLHSKCIY